MSQEMKETSSKRKLQDFALVVNELMITNGYLVEKAKFLKQQSKKIAEILKKNYKECINKEKSNSILKEEVLMIESKMNIITNKILSDINEIKAQKQEIIEKIDNANISNQINNLKLEIFILNNICKEKEAILQKYNNDLNLLIQYKIFKERKREIYFNNINDIEPYNSFLFNNKIFKEDSCIDSKRLLVNYHSNNVKREEKYKEIKKDNTQKLIKNLKNHLNFVLKQQKKNMVKQGYLMNLNNKKFGKKLIIQVEYLSSDIECSSGSEGMSIDTISSDKITDDESIESIENTKQLHFTSSDDSSNIDNNCQDNSKYEELKGLRQLIQKQKEEKKRLKGKIRNYELNEEQMKQHIKSLQESIRFTTNVKLELSNCKARRQKGMFKSISYTNFNKLNLLNNF